MAVAKGEGLGSRTWPSQWVKGGAVGLPPKPMSRRKVFTGAAGGGVDDGALELGEVAEGDDVFLTGFEDGTLLVGKSFRSHIGFDIFSGGFFPEEFSFGVGREQIE